MKTSSITLALILFTAILFGQNEKEKFSIEKGLWSIEGDISVNSKKSISNNEATDTSKNLSFSISPKIGYSIGKNLTLGIGTRYEYSKSKSDLNHIVNTFNHTINSFSISPYIKKFFPTSKRLAFHTVGVTELSLYKGIHENVDNKERKSKGTSYFIGLRPGVSYSLSKNLLLQANIGSIGYNYTEIKAEDKIEQKNNSFGLNVGSSSLTFGLSLFL